MKSAIFTGVMAGWKSVMLAACVAAVVWQTGVVRAADGPRERISINDDWRFTKGDPAGMTTNLTLLQVRQQGRGGRGPATATAPAASEPAPVNDELWPYIMATSNDFIKDPAKRVMPKGTFDTGGITYAAAEFKQGGDQK